LYLFEWLKAFLSVWIGQLIKLHTLRTLLEWKALRVEGRPQLLLLVSASESTVKLERRGSVFLPVLLLSALVWER
jgi:hypothetical protein